MKKKAKRKTETEMKMKTKMKTIKEMRIKMKSFCVFVYSTRPWQSLTWPRKASAFSFANFARGLAKP